MGGGVGEGELTTANTVAWNPPIPSPANSPPTAFEHEAPTGSPRWRCWSSCARESKGRPGFGDRMPMSTPDGWLVVFFPR